MADSSTTNTTSISSLIIPQNNQISFKLTDINFLSWKQQILSSVKGYGLEDYLTNDPPPSTVRGENDKPQPNPDLVLWNRQDQLLAAWIQSSLSESIMLLVVGLTTSKQIWESLLVNFSNQSKAKLMQYKLQLQTLKKEALPMRDYLSKVKTCCDLLGSAGYRVSDEDQVMHILAGLGADYDSVVVVVTSRPENWTVGDVHSLLLSFETRLESAKTTVVNTEGSQPSANFVQEGSSKRNDSNSGSQGKGRGYQGNNYNPKYRGGFGGRGRGGRGRGNGKPSCQLCGTPGHTVDRCYHRYEPNFVPRHMNQRPPNLQNFQPNFQSFQQQQQQPSLHLAHFPSANQFHPPSEYNFDAASHSTWYPDSGATNHVSHDYNSFHNANEYHGGSGQQGNPPSGHS